MVCIISAPERDHSYQPRFLICNHYQASGESGYILQRPGNGGRNRRLHAVSFLGLGHKFHTQGSHRGNTRSPCGRRRPRS